MDNNINTLDELNKGCSMGKVAIDFILEKIDDTKFKGLLEKQLIEYKELSSRINDLYKSYSDKDIDKVNLMEKAMTWYGIEKDTIMDKTISNIADILIRGTNMGIVEGKKLINNKTMDKKVHKICREYVKMQEDYLEKLKEYL